MRILEIGSYIAPAYAGMVLAEQGHRVEKWTLGTDPIHDLREGAALWQWINARKKVVRKDAQNILHLEGAGVPDIIIDNIRPASLQRRGIDPQQVASEKGVRWVSLRSEVGDTSFDVLAQARSWMEYSPWVPFYLGDTAAGLWLAFKALAVSQPGHYVIWHASALQKFVEGELIPRAPGPVPWDPPGSYWADSQEAFVHYRGRTYREMVRDREWKLENLKHDGFGRIII